MWLTLELQDISYDIVVAGNEKGESKLDEVGPHRIRRSLRKKKSGIQFANKPLSFCLSIGDPMGAKINSLLMAICAQILKGSGQTCMQNNMYIPLLCWFYWGRR